MRFDQSCCILLLCSSSGITVGQGADQMVIVEIVGTAVNDISFIVRLSICVLELLGGRLSVYPCNVSHEPTLILKIPLFE